MRVGPGQLGPSYSYGVLVEPRVEASAMYVFRLLRFAGRFGGIYSSLAWIPGRACGCQSLAVHQWNLQAVSESCRDGLVLRLKALFGVTWKT